jgi:RimJ/RimL family protein N-acetyltransferase/8-oxo-dGTP pyrophosphatase MutT (NUDIX family)
VCWGCGDKKTCRLLAYGAWVSVPAQLVLRDGDVVLRRPDAASVRNAVSFLVEHQGRVVGTVEVKHVAGGNGELSWAVFPEHRGQGLAAPAVRLMIRYAFDELGLHRVVAYADPDDVASLRTAGRAGLRREGLVRAVEESGGESSGEHSAVRHDRVQLARLATDPEPTSRDGFIGILNAALPTKRLIAQGLIRNSANEILLCELTYKQEWDLPGGVVDPHESPAHAVIREIREELQVEALPKSLVAVNWLPSWRGWDDAMLFVFDLGVDDDVIARASLEPRELRALHWCTLEHVERRAAPYVSRMLRRLALQREGTAYLEDGADPSS